jgi:dTDP-4-dehydrorhamnose 3,5-epimerase
MKVMPCDISGLFVIEPQVFADSRGFFMELWNELRYNEAGLKAPFVQDNLSRSRRGTLRGLHFQNPRAQGKLVSVLEGEVFDVAVDLRRSSPTFGRWHGLRLSSQNRLQFFVPPGLAHGFQVLSETALFTYKCTEFYSPKDEWTLRWNDPDLDVKWPIETPMLSEKDRQGLLLRQLPEDRLFP